MRWMSADVYPFSAYTISLRLADMKATTGPNLIKLNFSFDIVQSGASATLVLFYLYTGTQNLELEHKFNIQ
jgi:hypothetical protein